MNKKNKVIIGVMILFIAIVIGTIENKKIKKNIILNPEILRASSYKQVKPGDEEIDGIDFVQFDAYYMRDLDGDGHSEKLRGTCKQISMQDTLYMDLNLLGSGTLKNAKITINGKNFRLSTALVKDNVISKDYIGENTSEIILNDITNEIKRTIVGTIKSKIENDTSNYTIIDNTVTLTGVYVSNDGIEKEITKVVNLTNDWYGTARATIDSDEQKIDINSAVDRENQKLNLTFNIYTHEIEKELIILKNHVEAELPLINGYAPTNVSISNPNVVIDYDEEKRIVTADIESLKNEYGVVSNTISRDFIYTINVEYPIQAYTEDIILLTIPVSTYYMGYNNTQQGYENPYKSNVASAVLNITYMQISSDETKETDINLDLGKYNYSVISKSISKELPINIYNQAEIDNKVKDWYTVRWMAYSGKNSKGSNFIFKETPDIYTDRFLNTDLEYKDMLRYINNIGIYFINAQSVLGKNGYVNVYNDDTNELLHKFTEADWNKYNESNPYVYETPVKHIRVETSAISEHSYMYVHSVKEIDDVLLTAEYEREDFDKLYLIFSYLTGYINKEDGTQTKIKDVSNCANYELPYSNANISIVQKSIKNNETNRNINLNITAGTEYFNVTSWQNGEFLIKYPEEIIDVNINSITPTEKDVTITGIDTYKENENIYTKIYTSSKVKETFTLNIDMDMDVNPLKATTTKKIELYYYNPICNSYKNGQKDIYDVNGNGDKEENIGYVNIPIDIISSSTLLTSQTATNYDDKGSGLSIAPQEATINKKNEKTTATINGYIINNHSETISDIKILGKIPYKGNKNQINGSDLDSKFNTTMTSEGIRLPDNLKGNVTVYYSYNEKVTEDINAKKNCWTTLPEDFSKVKSYLIDLENCVMQKNDSYTYSYDVEIPNDLNYNDVSYSSHAVYYSINAEQKIKTQTEANKLGFRVTKKYDLEITNSEVNTKKAIAGSVFVAQEVGKEKAKIAIANEIGIAIIKNLDVEKEYIIKEIKTNDNYVLNENEVEIIGHNISDEFQIEILNGSFKTDPIIEVKGDENPKAKVVIDNEIKYNFELNKTELQTNEKIQGIRFELTDYGNTKKAYTTNKDGKLVLRLLEPNKQYTLTEIDSKGHYLKEPITFMMSREKIMN